MTTQSQYLELIENIKFLDEKQKTDVLNFVNNQLHKSHRAFVKKEALRDIKRALH